GESWKSQNQYFWPFPSMMRNRLRYSEAISLTTVASSDDAVAVYFSANGIFDPNVTGGGHQPYGHDTLANLYNHYRVDKAVITVRPGSFGSSLAYGIAITDDTSTDLTDSVMEERERTTYKIMGTAASDVNTGILTMEWRPDRSYPAAAGAQKNLNASYGSNPGEQEFFAVWHRRLGTAAAQTSIYHVQIDYWVTSYELQQKSQN
ncbi:hypothetical protein, partial [Rheinheimera sp.]|uniref:hypothetical protein n=1 Tax=Rheinheimera sp. TaxID=1869214 RepID=UPI004048AED2